MGGKNSLVTTFLGTKSSRPSTLSTQLLRALPPKLFLTPQHEKTWILQACCTGGQCMRFSRVACHYSMSILLHHWIIFAFMSWMGAWMGAMMQTEWWPKQPLVVYVRKWTRVTFSGFLIVCHCKSNSWCCWQYSTANIGIHNMWGTCMRMNACHLVRMSKMCI
jgi:hypothetical protein